MIRWRREDWPALLADYIEQCRHRPFDWGRHDCGTMLADWVGLACGWDPLEAVRGRYSSALGWERIRRRDGYRDAADVFDRAFAARTNPNFANRGDGAAIDGPDGPTVGILLGANIAVPGPDGLLFATRRDAIAMWSV